MGIFKREQLWDTLDDVGHYDGSMPWYSSWRSRRSGSVAFFIFMMIGLIFTSYYKEHESNRQLMRTWGKVKTGDKLFADSSAVHDTSSITLLTFRKIRPINADDINKMQIPHWKKLQLIADLDTANVNAQPLMIYSDRFFCRDTIYKYQTAFIGRFVHRDSLTHRRGDKGEQTTAGKWYAVVLNNAISESLSIEMPTNYVFADQYYYVYPSNVSPTEDKIFRNTDTKLPDSSTVVIADSSQKQLTSRLTGGITKKHTQKKKRKKAKSQLTT